MQITNQIIDIKGSTLADRLRLRQVLLDNEQIIWEDRLYKKGSYTSLIYDSYEGNGEWVKSNGKSTITLQDFIDKYKKSDKLQNLAFYKESEEPWTQEEFNNMYKLVNPKLSSATYGTTLVGKGKYFYDDGAKNCSYHAWGTTKPNLQNCLKVAYEEVFPEPKFEYPIYKIDYASGLVRKFTSLIDGVNVCEGNHDSPCNKVGYVSTSSIEHTCTATWQDWNPQFNYDAIMQSNTVVHCPTESEANELLYWASKNGVGYKTKNSWDAYKESTYYNIYTNSFGEVENHTTEYYTILTMDEARNGKAKPKENHMELTKDYYQYFENLFNAGVELEYSDKDNRVKHNLWHNYDGDKSPLEWFRNRPTWEVMFRLANRQPDEPNPMTPEYAEYWDNLHKTAKVSMYYYEGEVESVNINPSAWLNSKSHKVNCRVFFLKEEPKPIPKEDTIEQPKLQFCECYSQDTCAHRLETGNCNGCNAYDQSKDLEYWQAQYEAGNEVWVETLTRDYLTQCKQCGPNEWSAATAFYDHDVKQPTKDCSSESTTETSETTTTKETPMNNNTVTIEDARPQPKTFQEILVEIFGTQATTDLCNKPNFVAHVFNNDGALEKIIAIESNEAAIKMLKTQARTYLDYTVVVYKHFDTHVLDIPVTSARASKKAKSGK